MNGSYFLIFFILINFCFDFRFKNGGGLSLGRVSSSSLPRSIDGRGQLDIVSIVQLLAFLFFKNQLSVLGTDLD